MENAKYIQFPLFYLSEIAKNPKLNIDAAISYGVRKYALLQQYELKNVAKQVLYDSYHNKLTEELFQIIQTLYDNEELTKDEDYKGFIGSEFDPIETDLLLELFEKYPELKAYSIIHYQMHTAQSFLGVKLGENYISGYNKVNELLEDNELMHGKQPMPSVNPRTLFAFRDNPENIELLLAYVSIKSLIGQKHFTATNKDAIIQRMIGAKNKEALYYLTSNSEFLRDLYKKYINRYWCDKLLETLLKSGFISSKIGFKRKLYISTTLSFDELAVEAANFIKSKDMKQQEKKARESISQHLYNTTSI